MKIDSEFRAVLRIMANRSSPVGRLHRRQAGWVLMPLLFLPIDSYGQLGLIWDPNGASPGYGGSGNWTAAGAWLNPSTIPPSNRSWSNGASAGFAGKAGTVTLDSTVTAAALGFDISGYSVSGSGTLRLEHPSGPAELIANAGVTTLDVRVEGTGGLSKSGVGKVVMQRGFHVDGGTLVSGGTLDVIGDYGIWSPTTVRGSGSTHSCTGTFYPTTLDVTEGGELVVGGRFNVGYQILSQVIVDHGTIDAAATEEGSRWGYGGYADVKLRNGATGNFGWIMAAGPDTGSVCNITVENGSSFSFKGMQMGSSPEGTYNTYSSLVVSGTSTSPSHVYQTNPTSDLAVGIGSSGPFDPNRAPEATVKLNSYGTYHGSGNTVVEKTGLLWINGGSFESGGNLTVKGQLTFDSGGFTLPASGNLTVQDGGHAKFNSLFGLSGQTVNISGTGSLLETTGYLYLDHLTANVNAGGRLSSSWGLFIGTLTGDSLVDVSGSGSSLNCYGLGQSSLGAANHSGTLTFREGASGTLGSLAVGLDCVSAGGYFNVLSGSTVSSRSISAISGMPVTIGIVVSGTGSALSQIDDSVNAGIELGGSQDSAATFLVTDNGTFTSGSGTSTIHPTGAVQIHGGVYHARGDMVLNGGALTRDASGTFNLASGKSLTLQNEGRATFTGGWYLQNPATVNVASGSSIETTGVLAIAGGSNMNISAGGMANAGTELWIGTMASGDGSASVSGPGSSLGSAFTTFIGWSGKTGQLAVQEGATAQLGRLILAADGTDGSSGSLLVDSGAQATTGNIEIATSPAATQGTITVTGNRSSLLQSRDSGITLGTERTSAATIQVTSGGFLESGGGPVLVLPTGNFMALGGSAVLHGMVENHGTLQVVSGGLIDITDTLEHRGVISLADTGGTLRLSGEAFLHAPISGMGTVDCRGRLMPGGTGIYKLQLGGNLIMSSTSDIRLQIGGLLRGIQFDAIDVANTLTAAGRLAVTLAGGYQPQLGDTFDLFDGNLTSEFDVISMPSLASGLTWDTSALMTTGVVRVVPVELPPIQEWRNHHFGSPLNSGDGANEFDFDHDGWPNLLEYAFGGDPKTGDAATLTPTVEGDPDHASFSFRCDGACCDLTYTVQASPTLDGVWTDIAYSIGGGLFEVIEDRCTVEDSGTGLRVLTVTAAESLFASGKGFYRVRLTAPDD